MKMSITPTTSVNQAFQYSKFLFRLAINWFAQRIFTRTLWSWFG